MGKQPTNPRNKSGGQEQEEWAIHNTGTIYEKKGERNQRNRTTKKMETDQSKMTNIYADDVILKETETKQIYGKLESFGRAMNYHGVGINQDKIAILARAVGREIREIKKILPKRYRGVQFAKEATLLWQRIDLWKTETKQQKTD